MNRDGHNGAVFFIGGEVENTPAFSKKTLFVVNFQDTLEIEKQAKANGTPHIFLGANHSFDASHYTEHFAKTWDEQITYLLDKGFWVTLDYQAHQHETVLKMLNPGVWQSRLFVPLLSVRIPNIETSSPNLTVKIDDIDFNSTNPGVWCLHFHELTDSNRFTGWEEYETDLVIGTSPVEVVEKKVDTVVAAPAEEKQAVELNNANLGIDTTPSTSLNPDPVIEPVVDIASTPADAAEAYAQGATQDPLGKTATKVKGKK